MKTDCDRCAQKIKGTRFRFYEVDQQDRKHKFGTFCIYCSIELLDELRGKLEWFHVMGGWKGYIRPEARNTLEKTGFIHPKHNTQHIEITYEKN